jgi:hypothetical protein
MITREIEGEDLEAFFAQLADRFDLVKSYESRISRFEAPRFNVFNYIEPDENKATEILKDLLAPNGSHGQGSVFLMSFLRRIGFERPSKRAIESAFVRTQHQTGGNRYIDLTVILEDCIFALENKIDAGEQPNQVADYIDFLRCDYGEKWFFVFLTPSGRSPLECDPGTWMAEREAQRVLTFSYAELSAWLGSCIPMVSSERVRTFIQDMASWSEAICGGNMATELTKQIVLDFVTKNPKYLKTLLALGDTSGAVRLEIISDFAKSLEQALIVEFPQPDWIVTSKISETDLKSPPAGFVARKCSWPQDCSIGFEADSLVQGFWYGLKWLGGDELVKNKTLTAINTVIRGRKGTQWLWYRWIPNCGSVEARYWNHSETISAMHDERRVGLVNHLVGLIVSVKTAVVPTLDAIYGA